MSLTARKILIVDDHDQIRAWLCRLFSLHGYETLAVGTAYSAIEMLSHRPDVALIDLMLPDQSGVKVAEAIRDRKLPMRVVFVTAMADPVGKCNLDSLRWPYKVLTKPVELNVLLEAVGT